MIDPTCYVVKSGELHHAISSTFWIAMVVVAFAFVRYELPQWIYVARRYMRRRRQRSIRAGRE